MCKIVTENYYKVTDSVWVHYEMCPGETRVFTNQWLGVKDLVFPRALDDYLSKYIGQPHAIPTPTVASVSTSTAPPITQKTPKSTVSARRPSTRSQPAIGTFPAFLRTLLSGHMSLFLFNFAFTWLQNLLGVVTRKMTVTPLLPLGGPPLSLPYQRLL